MPNRSTQIAVAAALTCIIAVLAPSPALAGHGQNPTADDEYHKMDRNNLTSYGNAAATHARDQLSRPAEFSATFTGTGDVEWYDGNYGDNGYLGWARCTDWWAYGYVCDVWSIKLNSYWIPATYGAWRSVGCHELGHTAGLGHRGDGNDGGTHSCMRDDWTFPQQIDLHDIDVINSKY